VLGELKDEEQIRITANLAASRFPGVALWDSAAVADRNKLFLKAFGAAKQHRLRSAEEAARFEETLLEKGPAGGDFSRAVVCAAQPRRLLLKAANLASALRAPLWILHEKGEAELWSDLQARGFRDVYTVGKVPIRLGRPAACRIHSLP